MYQFSLKVKRRSLPLSRVALPAGGSTSALTAGDPRGPGFRGLIRRVDNAQRQCWHYNGRTYCSNNSPAVICKLRLLTRCRIMSVIDQTDPVVSVEIVFKHKEHAALKGKTPDLRPTGSSFSVRELFLLGVCSWSQSEQKPVGSGMFGTSGVSVRTSLSKPPLPENNRRERGTERSSAGLHLGAITGARVIYQVPTLLRSVSDL